VERLWTPWRREYIESVGQDAEGCIFCDKPSAGDDEATYILARSDLAFAMLNAYPYNPGHLLVAPFRHVGDLEEVDTGELSEMSGLLQRAITAMKEAARPHGFNLGMNLGRVAGAGIPGHLHWHLVPRWDGDTNFMPLIGETKVLAELLSDTYVKLRPLF
jgi:ATP adenylyltransferase